jgi:hypothetical protein
MDQSTVLTRCKKDEYSGYNFNFLRHFISLLVTLKRWQLGLHSIEIQHQIFPMSCQVENADKPQQIPGKKHRLDKLIEIKTKYKNDCIVRKANEADAQDANYGINCFD